MVFTVVSSLLWSVLVDKTYALGKVTVIKTFAIAKLIHLIIVFENQNINICNNLTTEIFIFV